MSKGLDFIKSELELNDECFTDYERLGLKQVEKELKVLEIIRNSNMQFKEMQIGTGYGLTIYVDINNEEECNLVKKVLCNE